MMVGGPVSAPCPLPDALHRALGAGEVDGIMVFGGSFDPVQRAHVELPARAREGVQGAHGGRWWLLYVPAAASPLKGRRPMASDEDRLRLLEIALRGVARGAVWRDELERAAGGPSYTVDTLARLRRSVDAAGGGGVPLRLLIGSDQARQFHRWKAPREIIAMAPPLVMRRSGESAEELRRALEESGAWDALVLAAWESWQVDAGRSDASSTRARELLARSPVDRGALLRVLDPEVLAEIERRGLYRGGE
ncbi:MAG: nicotinate-nicotinamide nucleotide adenylyltransferase [Phycisphaeraceae bacterium]|nr:nicotinate-nicotinamide nucleotide adenylyltransferase [Phycisphaeraceae bacterium]